MNISLVEETLARSLQFNCTFTFAEIFCELNEKLEIVSEDGQIISASSGFEGGTTIRLKDQELTLQAFTEDLTEAGCNKLAQNIHELSGSQDGNGSVGPETVRYLLSEAPSSPLMTRREDWDTQFRQMLVQGAETATSAAAPHSPGVRKVRVKSIIGRRFWLVVNSEGLRAEDQRTYTTVTVQSSVERSGQKQIGTITRSMLGLPPIPAWNPARMGVMASERATRLLESKPVPAGVVPIVLAAGAGGLLIHEACGHALEADALYHGSIFSGLEGRAIATPAVTLVDSARVKDGWGSFHFDDEGQPGAEIVLVDQGVLCGQLRDLAAARRAGGVMSSNGRRASYRHQPIPRMTNTYLLPGDLEPQEIIEATNTGLYACEFKGGQVNPVTGDFSFFVQEGFLIRDGKLAEPVRGATVAGNARHVLQQIDMVANDLAFAPATCLKAGQYVPVGLGQPTVRVQGLLVRGAQA